jgi:hypothetical protein
MRGAVPQFPQYGFTTWCLTKQDIRLRRNWQSVCLGGLSPVAVDRQVQDDVMGCLPRRDGGSILYQVTDLALWIICTFSLEDYFVVYRSVRCPLNP